MLNIFTWFTKKHAITDSEVELVFMCLFKKKIDPEIYSVADNATLIRVFKYYWLYINDRVPPRAKDIRALNYFWMFVNDRLPSRVKDIRKILKLIKDFRKTLKQMKGISNETV